MRGSEAYKCGFDFCSMDSWGIMGKSREIGSFLGIEVILGEWRGRGRQLAVYDAGFPRFTKYFYTVFVLKNKEQRQAYFWDYTLGCCGDCFPLAGLTWIFRILVFSLETLVYPHQDLTPTKKQTDFSIGASWGLVESERMNIWANRPWSLFRTFETLEK